MIRKDSKMKNTNYKTDSINFQNITSVKKGFDLSEYDMLQNLRGENNKLQCEKDSLVKLANNRYDEIENLKEIVNQYSNEPQNQSLVNEVIKLKEENQKLEHLVKHLKTEMRVARSFLEYENNEDLR